MVSKHDVREAATLAATSFGETPEADQRCEFDLLEELERGA
jgi:hypothetical protein